MKKYNLTINDNPYEVTIKEITAKEVSVEVNDAKSSEQEAVLLKLDAELVEVDGKTVKAQAKSLNQAYTVVSRRLEPQRRGYGGRAYDHVAWRNGSQWVPLETIRCAVESGEWEAQ